jgi:hypothetical protein
LNPPNIATQNNELKISPGKMCAVTVPPKITNPLQTNFLQQMVQEAAKFQIQYL